MLWWFSWTMYADIWWFKSDLDFFIYLNSGAVVGKCPKIIQNGPKCLKICHNYPKTPTKLTTLQIQNPRTVCLCCFEPFWVILGDFGWFWATLGHFGPFWAIYAIFQVHWFRSSRSSKWWMKIKYDLNNQMSAYMVQENHWKKLIKI